MKTKKLNGLTKVIALMLLSSLVMFTGCNAYDDEVKDLQGQIDGVVTEVSALKTSVAALQTSVSGMTYIKSIALGTDGKLIITPSTGTAITYDAKDYVTYDIKLEGNKLFVNGQEKGSVTIPALTFNNGKLMSGTTEVADLTNFFKSALTLGADNYLYINGQKTTVMVPPATVQSVDVKDVSISGNTLTFTKNDGTKVTINLPANTITLGSAYDAATGTLTLTVNGIETKVVIKNTYGVQDGFLTVNGVKTTVAIPAANSTSVIYTKDNQGNIISATISDGKDTFTVKLNPSTQLLSGLIFIPSIIEAGVNTVDYKFVYNETETSKALFEYQVLTFRFNPSTANVDNKTEWSFLANSAQFRAPMAAGQDVTGLFDTPKFTNKGGFGEFVLKAKSDPWAGVDNNVATTGLKRLIMLQAKSKDFYDTTKVATVTSDYVKVQPEAYKAAIVKKSSFATYHTQSSAPSVLSEIPTVDFQIEYDGGANNREKDLAVEVRAAAGKIPNGSLNLLETLNFGKLNENFKFIFDDNFVVKGSDDTDQNEFGSVTANGLFTIAQGAASQDRNPIVRVKLVTIPGDVVLATSYIRINIVKPGQSIEPEPPVNYDYLAPISPIAYQSLFTATRAGVYNDTLTSIELPWLQMNQQVYNKIGTNGLSHNDFVALYGDPAKTDLTVTATYKGANDASAKVYTPTQIAKAFKLFASKNGPNFDTYAMQVKISPYVKFGENVVSYQYKPKDASKAVVTINIKFNIVEPKPATTLIAAYLYQGDGVRVQGTKPAGVYQQQVYLGEAHGYNNGSSFNSYNGVFGSTTGKVDSAFHKLSFQDKYVKNNIPSLLLTPASATNGTATALTDIFGNGEGTGPLLQVNPANVIDVPVRDYMISLTSTYPNGETTVNTWKAYFINPLTITSAGNYTLTDLVTPDTKNVSGNYTVTDLGVTVASPALSYALTVGKYSGTAQDYPLYFTAPNLTWNNSGTRLQQTVEAGKLKATFTTSYATISVENTVTVIPSAGNFAPRK